MEQFLIERFAEENKKFFAQEDLPLIKDALIYIEDDFYDVVSALDFKSPQKMQIISVLGGLLGIDRFIIGDTAIGILKLLVGGFFIPYIVDWFLIKKATRKFNKNLLLSTVDSSVVDPTKGNFDWKAAAVKVATDPEIRKGVKEIKRSAKEFQDSFDTY